MPQRTATIESLPMAFAAVKEMRADGLEWGEGYRPLGRQALAEIIQGRMDDPDRDDRVLDRIVHSAYRIELKGESQRKRNKPPPLDGGNGNRAPA